MSNSVTRDDYYSKLFAAFPMDPPRQLGGTIHHSVTGDMTSLNPLLASDSVSFCVTGLLFESLVALSPVDGSPVPQLAEGWDIASDGTTFVFYVNRRARWHDGSDVTAHDVKFSIDAIVNEAVASPYCSTVRAVLDACRIVDPYTLEIKSRGGIPSFPLDFGQYIVVIPRHVWRDTPLRCWLTCPGSTGLPDETGSLRVVGTGPFRFQERRPGDRIVLARNGDYWDPAAVPRIEKFVVRKLDNISAEIAGLAAHEIDIVKAVPASDVRDVAGNQSLRIAEYDNTFVPNVGFNLDARVTPLFQDRRVREALAVGLDRQKLIDDVYLGLGEVAVGTQPRLSPAYAPCRIEKKHCYDRERAGRLLDEAGWLGRASDGTRQKDGQAFRFELLTFTGAAVTAQVAASVREQWRELGIDVRPSFLPWPAMLDRVSRSRQYEATLNTFGWAPNGDQGSMFECAADAGGYNHMKYCNPEYDYYNQLARAARDPDARIDWLVKAANVVNNDLPIIPLRFSRSRCGHAARLRNFYPNGYGGLLWSIPFVWIDDTLEHRTAPGANLSVQSLTDRGRVRE